MGAAAMVSTIQRDTTCRDTRCTSPICRVVACGPRTPAHRNSARRRRSSLGSRPTARQINCSTRSFSDRPDSLTGAVSDGGDHLPVCCLGVTAPTPFKIRFCAHRRVKGQSRSYSPPKRPDRSRAGTTPRSPRPVAVCIVSEPVSSGHRQDRQPSIAGKLHRWPARCLIPRGISPGALAGCVQVGLLRVGCWSGHSCEHAAGAAD